MGAGGGGWGSGPRSGASVDQAIAETAASASYEADANAYLQDLLASHNDRDATAIRGRIETIRKAIEKDIDGEVYTLFGGSVRKHTYVDGISDVDVLLAVNASELANATPAEVLHYVERRLGERLGALGVRVKAGNLAVTVSYADGTEIQVLPALRTARGVRIASVDGTWSQVVRPQEFARKLTIVNQANNSRVVPVVKLFKGLQTQLPATNQLKGYHIESLAIEAFKDYRERQTYKDMLKHFVRCAAERVRSPIADSTGQSLHVDDYLGAAGSPNRRRVAASLSRLADRLAAADKRSSLEGLKNVFGD